MHASRQDKQMTASDSITVVCRLWKHWTRCASKCRSMLLNRGCWRSGRAGASRNRRRSTPRLSGKATAAGTTEFCPLATEQAPLQARLSTHCKRHHPTSTTRSSLKVAACVGSAGDGFLDLQVTGYVTTFMAVQARLSKEPHQQPWRWPQGGRQIHFSGVDRNGLHNQRNIGHTVVQVRLMARHHVTLSLGAALYRALGELCQPRSSACCACFQQHMCRDSAFVRVSSGLQPAGCQSPVAPSCQQTTAAQCSS